MANYLYTPERAALRAAAILRNVSVIPNTLRNVAVEAGGQQPGLGQVYNVRSASDVGAAHARTIATIGPDGLPTAGAGNAETSTTAADGSRNPFITNRILGGSTPVKIDTELYHRLAVPDDFATFNISDATEQVFRPQMEAAADAAQASALRPLLTATADTTVRFEADGSNALEVFTAADRIFAERKIPTVETRYAAVGAGVYEALLNLRILTEVDTSGTPLALREAILGRLRGFIVFRDVALPANEAIFYTREAAAFITVAPKVPAGAPFGAVAGKDGYALRWVMVFDSEHGQDISLMNTFVGGGVLSAARILRVGTSSTSDATSNSAKKAA